MPEATAPPRHIVLASQSAGRRALLARLFADFDTLPADIDESPLSGELPDALAARLARQKAQTVATRSGPDLATALIIGADQVAVCAGETLGKPMTAARNIEQLLACSGKQATFFSAVCVIDNVSGQQREHTDVTTVHFDDLDHERVARYVERDQPWFCAGGFMAERSGISLFRAITSDDPTGLVGLPLIFVSHALREFGCPL